MRPIRGAWRPRRARRAAARLRARRRPQASTAGPPRTDRIFLDEPLSRGAAAPPVGLSARVVKDDPEGRPAALGDRAHAVPQRPLAEAAPAGLGAFARREDHERARLRREDVRAALRARALLEQDELAAFEAVLEHGQDLEREVDVAVEVLVQSVP